MHKIYIDGNSVLSDGKIKRTMKKTNEKGSLIKLFSQKKFVRSDYDADKQRIIDKYNELGYRDAKITWDSVSNYNLLDDYWEAALTQQHSVNLSGATDQASYFASVSYFDQEGNLGKLDYNRWNFRAGTDLKIGKWWKAALSVSGDYGKRNSPLMKVQKTSGNQDYMNLLAHPRLLFRRNHGRQT